MDKGMKYNILSKCPTLLDCYALVLNPVSPWNPISVLSLLSHELDFILAND